MATSLGELHVTLALHVTVDGCEHTTHDEEMEVLGYMREKFPAARLVVTPVIHNGIPATHRDVNLEAEKPLRQLSEFFDGGMPVEDEFRRRIVSRSSYTSVEPDEQVVDPGTVRASAGHAEHILARLRGVQLTPEDGHRIVEAVWTRVL